MSIWGRWLEYETPYCNITIEKRVAHCKRGRYLAKAFPRSRECEINHQSGWPRYYFSLQAAMEECEAWLDTHVPGERGRWRRRELSGDGVSRDLGEPYGAVAALEFLEGSGG